MKLKKKMQKTYENLMGISENPNIPSIFYADSKADRLYSDIYLHKQKLLEKLGMDQEDADMEKIIENLLSISKIISYKMFFYGYFSKK